MYQWILASLAEISKNGVGKKLAAVGFFNYVFLESSIDGKHLFKSAWFITPGYLKGTMELLISSTTDMNKICMSRTA